MKKTSIEIIILSALFILLPVKARATSLIPLSLRDLTLWSDAVAVGVCDEVWSGDDQKVIKTFSRFRVEEVWKGSGPEEITVSTLGGRSGGKIAVVGGVPRFEKGKRSVLFLQAFPDGTYGVVGFFQGKFDVEDEGEGEESPGGKRRLLRRSGGEGNDGVSGAIELLKVPEILNPGGSIELEKFKEAVFQIIKNAK